MCRGNAPNSPPWGLLLSLCVVLSLPRGRIPATAHTCIDHSVASGFLWTNTTILKGSAILRGQLSSDNKGTSSGMLQGRNTMWSHWHVGVANASTSHAVGGTKGICQLLQSQGKIIKHVPYSFPNANRAPPAIIRQSASSVELPTALPCRDRRSGRGASWPMGLAKNSLRRSCRRGGTSPGNRIRRLGRDIPPQYPKGYKESIRRHKLWIWIVFFRACIRCDAWWGCGECC